MHTGLQVAMSLTDRDALDESQSPYVNEKTVTAGCDTIFVLSDGAPNWDAFAIADQVYDGQRGLADLENGTVDFSTTPSEYTYVGPYGKDTYWLLRDVQRMNALRNVQIHCVGLGEANAALLQSIAVIGKGEVFLVGQK